MTGRSPHPHRFSRSLLAAATLLAGGMLPPSGEAMAQSSAQVDVYGYVAPRCWAASSRSFQGSLAARCNHGAPLLRSNIRALSIDGSFATLANEADRDQQSAREAMEIIVSPQL